MSEHIFDVFTRRATTAISRRGMAHVLTGFALSWVGGSLLRTANAEAKKKGKRTKGKKCTSNEKKCGQKCIPKSNCCLECSGGKTCQDGTCACPKGQYDCQGTCIPETERCTAFAPQLS